MCILFYAQNWSDEQATSYSRFNAFLCPLGCSEEKFECLGAFRSDFIRRFIKKCFFVDKIQRCALVTVFRVLVLYDFSETTVKKSSTSFELFKNLKLFKTSKEVETQIIKWKLSLSFTPLILLKELTKTASERNCNVDKLCKASICSYHWFYGKRNLFFL